MKEKYILISILLILLIININLIFAESSCSDSDGGKNYYEKGSIYDEKTKKTCVDFCRNKKSNQSLNKDEYKISGCEGEDCQLIEGYCENSTGFLETYECPYGCEEGVCRKESKKIFNDFKYLIENGNSEEKLDIFFIRFNITEEDFENAIDSILYSKGRQILNSPCGNITSRGLFEVEPFKSFQNKFNIEYADKQLDFNYFNCQYKQSLGLVSKPGLYCNWRELKKNIPFNPEIIVVIGKDFQTFANEEIILMGDPHSSSVDTNAGYEDSFVHEFGHAFGGLTDEYGASFTSNCDNDCYYVTLPDPCINSKDPSCFSRTEKEISLVPNEDIIGCPKWCEEYDENKLDELSERCISVNNKQDCFLMHGCLWFEQKHPWFNANCVPGTTEINIGIDCNCMLRRHFNHLSFSQACTDGGMMWSQYGDFNPVSKEHLKTALECCFPKSNSVKCRGFSEKFKLSSEINSYFGFAYDKFAECYSENNQEIEPDKTVEICFEETQENNSIKKNVEVVCENGCIMDNACYQTGWKDYPFKEGKKYCSEEKIFVDQKQIKDSCKNNYECESHRCINDKCVKNNLLRDFLEWLKEIFRK